MKKELVCLGYQNYWLQQRRHSNCCLPLRAAPPPAASHLLYPTATAAPQAVALATAVSALTAGTDSEQVCSPSSSPPSLPPRRGSYNHVCSSPWDCPPLLHRPSSWHSFYLPPPRVCHPLDSIQM